MCVCVCVWVGGCGCVCVCWALWYPIAQKANKRKLIHINPELTYVADLAELLDTMSCIKLSLKHTVCLASMKSCDTTKQSVS